MKLKGKQKKLLKNLVKPLLTSCHILDFSIIFAIRLFGILDGKLHYGKGN
jgi:hypothetical protein